MSFEIKRTSKKCSVTDRPLAPGETFYSALVEQGDDFVRSDYSQEAWQGPPADCIGWWKTKLPEVTKGKIYWVPQSILISYFEHLLQQPAQSEASYVMGLLLIQKKMLSIDESIDPMPHDSPTMTLKDRKTNQIYNVPIVDVSPEKEAEIQQQLAEHLFSDVPVESTDDEQQLPEEQSEE